MTSQKINWDIVSKLQSLGYSQKDAVWLSKHSETKNYLKKVKNPYPKISKIMQKRISKKIIKLIREGYSQTQAAAIAYSMARRRKIGPLGGKKRNPISDEFLPQIIVIMMFLQKYPEKCNQIPDALMSVLSEEKLFNPDKCEITDKGRNFLINARKLSRDEIE
jgi:hypothetical protein